MAISTYTSIITLNVNGLNALIKRHTVADWIKKIRTFPYAAYKRLTSGLKPHKDWKQGDIKGYFMQTEITRKWRWQ